MYIVQIIEIQNKLPPVWKDPTSIKNNTVITIKHICIHIVVILYYFNNKTVWNLLLLLKLIFPFIAPLLK
mgnify:CR=1 FL=1